MTQNNSCPRPFVLGLTGGIACGKSHVSRVIKHENIPVIDADVISRALTADFGPALPAIEQAFGDSVFTAPGILNRKALGNLVFNDPEALAKLNSILHPMIFGVLRDSLRALSHRPLVVLEIPLMYETGADGLCHAVWTIETTPRLQLERLMRRGFSRQEAQNRIDAQLPSAVRRQRSDLVIDSSGDKQATAQTVRAALNRLQKELPPCSNP